jgi:hypothetical protein
MLDSVRTAAHAATDTLILYFAGRLEKINKESDLAPNQWERVASGVFRDRRVSAKVIRSHDSECQVCGTFLEMPGGRRYARAVPDHFIVSACRAPSDLRKDRLWHELPDDELIAALVALGAEPEPFQVDELRELALPVLRADLEVVERFDTAPRTPLRSAITAVAGVEDPDAKPELMAGWARETVGGFAARTLAGGHFLLEERPADMINVVRDVLNG